MAGADIMSAAIAIHFIVLSPFLVAYSLARRAAQASAVDFCAKSDRTLGVDRESGNGDRPEDVGDGR
jgi:hypothetical protein